jgi:SAM-dependent methyltransferase
MPSIPPAPSVTHDHLLAVLATESAGLPPGSTLRLLDVGCGDGKLLAFFAQGFPLLRPGVSLELYGFDVAEPGVQRGGYLARAVAELRSGVPGVDWSRRLVSIGTDQPWPYPDGFFDAIVSNQVLEHVADHRRFFAELSRTLAWNGFSVHLFPLIHYVYEGHLRLPLVHRIANHDLRRQYIAWLSALGLGKYPRQRRSTGISRATFAERHADYVQHYTNYLSAGQALRLGKQHGLRASFRYTDRFYSRKLARALLGRRQFQYRRPGAVWAWASALVLRYVSSVTLFLEKKESYRHPDAGRTAVADAGRAPVPPACLPTA